MIRRSFGPRLAAAREALRGRAGSRGGAIVLQRRGDRGLGPQQQPRLVARRARQRGQPLPRERVIAFAPLALLADVGLDDAHVHDRQRVFGDRRGREQPQEQGGAEDQHQRQPLLVKFEPDRAAEQDDQPRQAVGAGQRADGDQWSRRHRRRGRIPREASEHRRAQPFGEDPRPAEHQDQDDAIVAPRAPRNAGGERGKEGQVERQQQTPRPSPGMPASPTGR